MRKEFELIQLFGISLAIKSTTEKTKKRSFSNLSIPSIHILVEVYLVNQKSKESKIHNIELKNTFFFVALYLESFFVFILATPIKKELRDKLIYTYTYKAFYD